MKIIKIKKKKFIIFLLIINLLQIDIYILRFDKIFILSNIFFINNFFIKFNNSIFDL